MKQRQSYLGALISLIFTVAFVGLMLYLSLRVAKGIFTVLSWVAPVLIIAALIINYKVVLNYIKWLFRLLGNNLLYGILASLMTIVLFPLVAAWLCFKAVLLWRIQRRVAGKRFYRVDEYAEYEEIESELGEKKTLKDTSRKTHR